MLGRIDTIYRFCQKYGHQFVMPTVSSNLHEKNYDQIFGINLIKPRIDEWQGPVKTIDMKDLEARLQDVNGNTLLVVRYDHIFSRSFLERHNLKDIPKFNYQPHIKLLSECHQKNIDYLIHLRLGDNYIYSLPDGSFLDIGRRRIIDSVDSIRDEFEKQWSINGIKLITHELKNRGISYKVHCDGIKSAIRYIRWSKDPKQIDARDMLISTVEKFEKDFMDSIPNDEQLCFGNVEITRPVIDLLQSKTLIYTSGGFMKSLNRFWNPSPAESIHYKKFINSISDLL